MLGAEAQPGSRGELRVSLEVLPKLLAAQRKAGQGREEPNAYPVLEEPDRMHFSPRPGHVPKSQRDGTDHGAGCTVSAYRQWCLLHPPPEMHASTGTRARACVVLHSDTDSAVSFKSWVAQA